MNIKPINRRGQGGTVADGREHSATLPPPPPPPPPLMHGETKPVGSSQRRDALCAREGEGIYGDSDGYIAGSPERVKESENADPGQGEKERERSREGGKSRE